MILRIIRRSAATGQRVPSLGPGFLAENVGWHRRGRTRRCGLLLSGSDFLGLIRNEVPAQEDEPCFARTIPALQKG